MFDLPTIWAGLLALAIFIYVILDGFDLGIGIVFPFLKNDADRDVAMNSVAPVWDGNETWLVLGGGGLFAAFPLAYAVVMPALYAPFIIMILALVFRGVAFEYRWRDKAHEKIWDRSFFFGSLIATFCQGIVLGAFVQGIEVDGRAYGGGWWDWLTPFTVTCGIALVAGYALLGTTWLVLKTEGTLRDSAYRFAIRSGLATLAFVGIVSLWTPFLSPEIADAHRDPRCNPWLESHQTKGRYCVPNDNWSVRALLCRAWHRHHALHCAARDYDPGGGRA